jgi:hypothetical protein
MRSILRISSLLLCCLLFVHCSDDSVCRCDWYPPLPDVTVPDLNVDIPIGYGKTVLVEDEDLYITFTDLTEGRCPIGAVCFWEGQAVTKFQVVVPDKNPRIVTTIIRPSGDPDTNPEMTDYAFGYSFTILELEPYPDIDRPYDPSEYVAVLRIESNDNEDVDRLYKTTTHPSRLQRDPVTVIEGSIEGDVLTLTVQYGGGCGNHRLRLYWRGDWLESYPVQTSLFVQHVNIDDPCEAIISEERSYSIREIADDYRDVYGGYDDIILNVYGYFEDEPDQNISVTYSPE